MTQHPAPLPWSPPDDPDAPPQPWGPPVQTAYPQQAYAQPAYAPVQPPAQQWAPQPPAQPYAPYPYYAPAQQWAPYAPTQPYAPYPTHPPAQQWALYPPTQPYAPYPTYPPGAWGSPQPGYGWPPPPRDPSLDDTVQAGLHVPGRWWLAGLLQVLIPLGSMAVTVLVVVLLGLPVDPDTGALYSVVAGLLSFGLVLLSGRAIARRHGGWAAAFGLVVPRWRDVPSALGWFGINLGSRFAFVVVLAAVSPELADSHGGNISGDEAVSAAGVVLLLVSTVVIAPVMEELAFRGILLRGLMRRMSFWPAALLSSLLFSLLHAPGAAEPAGIPLLLALIMLFAVLQCLLVRRTGRLAPAMGVHALMNLLVTVLALTGG